MGTGISEGPPTLEAHPIHPALYRPVLFAGAEPAYVRSLSARDFYPAHASVHAAPPPVHPSIPQGH